MILYVQKSSIHMFAKIHYWSLITIKQPESNLQKAPASSAEE